MTEVQPQSDAEKRYTISSYAGQKLAKDKIRVLTRTEQIAIRKPDRRAALVNRWARWMLQSVHDAGTGGIKCSGILAAVKEAHDREPPDAQTMEDVLRIVHRDLKEIAAVDAEEKRKIDAGIIPIRSASTRKPIQRYNPARDRLNQSRLR